MATQVTASVLCSIKIFDYISLNWIHAVPGNQESLIEHIFYGHMLSRTREFYIEIVIRKRARGQWLVISSAFFAAKYFGNCGNYSQVDTSLLQYP